MPWEVGEDTTQIATDGKYRLSIGQKGVGSGKAVVLPRAVLQKSGTCGAVLPTSPGAAHRDVSHQDQGVFPRLLDPSPQLAGIRQPVLVFRGSRQAGVGNTRLFFQ